MGPKAAMQAGQMSMSQRGHSQLQAVRGQGSSQTSQRFPIALPGQRMCPAEQRPASTSASPCHGMACPSSSAPTHR
eukprot:4013536-Amphidinium_carterae.1